MHPRRARHPKKDGLQASPKEKGETNCVSVCLTMSPILWSWKSTFCCTERQQCVEIKKKKKSGTGAKIWFLQALRYGLKVRIFIFLMSRQVASESQSYTLSHLSAICPLSVRLQPKARWKTMGTFKNVKSSRWKRPTADLNFNVATRANGGLNVSENISLTECPSIWIQLWRLFDSHVRLNCFPFPSHRPGAPLRRQRHDKDLLLSCWKRGCFTSHSWWCAATLNSLPEQIASTPRWKLPTVGFSF